MYEVSTHELMVFVVLGFSAGVFASFYLTRLFEVVHMWRLLREVIAHLLLMCLTIIEDVEFLKELKRKQMHESGFTPEQIHRFQEVDDKTLTNWKDTVILSLVAGIPRSFRTMMPFNNWHEAMAFLKTELRALGGEK
tara:strand:- start:70 stop:480 length:411 start_codon:yes stop_codon:yes gene_type:complete